MASGTEKIRQHREDRYYQTQYRDKQAAHARRKAQRKLAKGKRKQSALRAKYGPAGKPAPVKVTWRR